MSFAMDDLMYTWTFQKKLHKHRRTMDGVLDEEAQ